MMLKILDGDILDSLANPFILTDEGGRILRMNDQAEALIRLSGLASPVYIYEIDPGLRPPWPGARNLETVRIGKRVKKLHSYPVRTNEKKGEAEGGRLFVFDTPEVLKKMDFDTFLEYIDESVIVADQDSSIEHLNSISQELTGLRRFGPGASLREMERNGKFDQSGTVKVLESKKTEIINMHFDTGKTVTYTCIPFFNKNGTVCKVISTGRNVTKLVKLQESLKKIANLKNHYLNRIKELESLVGSNTIVHASDQIREIADLSVKAAKSDSPVFIWGESGVGKELFANLIHESSPRRKEPFICINCAAVPSELLESEFFGYEEGAFTGAKKAGKTGLFEKAAGGTLLLDEITELPFSMQGKLLRVIQEKEFMRVGSTKLVPLRARIISASNLNKEALTDPKKFRRDLYYRLNVIPIYIPPLKDRREDIFPLVRFFLRNMNLKYNTNVKISPALMTRFYNYDWPGNVRELKNIIERLIVMSDKTEVGLEDYRLISRLEERVIPSITAEQTNGRRDADIAVSRLMPLKTAFQKVEELLITMAFDEHRTIVKAAEVLEINPCTIHRRIKDGMIHLRGKRMS